MTTHIPTLLQREWMQHKRGWLITAILPPTLFLLAMLTFGEAKGVPTDHPELSALAIFMVTTVAVFSICLVIALFQLPGLARRDVQDRSIEFWLSLPGRPSESVLSTALAHAWLAPLGGGVVGALFGLPIAASVLTAQAGPGLALSVNWIEVITAAAPLTVRGFAGTVLLMLWLAPFVFALMAASAWLKRLGVPVVLVGGGVLVTVLHKAYGIDWPLEALNFWSQRVSQTLIHNTGSLVVALKSDVSLWSWAAQDLLQTLADLASLQFLTWAAVAVAGFALVVAKRTRAG